MITSDTPVFPNNVVDLVALRVQALDADLAYATFKRPLRHTDPIQAVGVFGMAWLPNEESYEILGGPAGPSAPTLQTYRITIQGFVKDMDDERGSATHSVLSKRLRSMLYRDNALRVGLVALSVSMDGVTERTKRWGILNQRFLSNEVDGSWLYLSTLDFWLETETR